MSVLSTIELLCYFESLRNVDLFEQGFYSVRAKIYTEKNNIAAVPLTLYNTSSPARKIDNPRHKLFSPDISPERNTYTTKTFWVQYSEEVIDLNEAVHFRIDVPDVETQSLLLEMELLFSPEETTSSIDQLKPVSHQKFRMKLVHRGLNQFYPVIFDEWHFAVVRFAVHACLIDFTYKPSLASFLRFTSISSAYDEQDRTDISLFGIPCRKLLQDSYTKLSKNFQKICVHVPAKQRTTLGSDFFVTSPLSISASNLVSKSVSAPSSPITGKHNLTIPTAPNSPLPLNKPRSSSLFSLPSLPPMFALDPSSLRNRSNSAATANEAAVIPNTNTNNNSNNNSNNDSTTSTQESDSSDEEDEDTNGTESTSTTTTTSTTTSTNSITSATDTSNTTNEQDKVNPLKLFLILNNVRDQNGIGSPRAPVIPPSTGAPPPFALMDTKAANAIVAGNSATLTSNSRTNSNSSSPGTTPRMAASTGNRPSPRDCTSALSFFSRPATPMTPNTPSTPNFTHSTSSGHLASSINSNNNSSDEFANNTLRTKINSLPNVPLLAEEIRKTRKDRSSLTCTIRPQLGQTPQDSRTKEIMTQLHHMGDQIFALWVRFTKVFHLVGKENTFRIAQKYEQKYLKLFKESVFREVAHIFSVGQILELQANPQRHRQMVQTVRNSEYYKKLKTSRFELVIPRPELAGQPIILEQLIDVSKYAAPDDIIRLSEDDVITTSPANPPTPPPSRPAYERQHSYVNNPPKACSGSHLYIMVHGLAGNPWDLRMFRNQIALNFPESEFLICTCVEQDTLGDIEEMGNNVAKEISEYLKSTSLIIGKISFVGHSLGGVIIRAALCDPLLAPYLDKLYTFVSLSVPHIGTLYPYSSLIPGAMWVWQKWSNSACLLQLRLIDHSDPTKTYLYKLSQKKGLEYFQNILLVSSEQDLYVPFHSARIELCQEALDEGKKEERKKEDRKSEKLNGQKFTSPLVGMVRNVWEGVLEGWRARGRFGEIARYDVVFESHRGVDGMIGRSAHIRLLDSPKVMQMLITTNANLFK